jgi:glutathione S-transferase
MAIKLYDLAGENPDRRFSPYCWRTKMALTHKGLEFETIPWRFTDKEKIAFSGSERVPVIVDGDQVVADSWKIATYLEDTYRERPSLFGGVHSRAAALFINSWADTVLNPTLARLLVMGILEHLDPGDRDYFRESREKRFGITLEEFSADVEGNTKALRAVLEPLRLTLASQPFLGGDTPLYADYIVFGSLQWARSIGKTRLLELNDPVEAWRSRLLDSFGGFARNAHGYW